MLHSIAIASKTRSRRKGCSKKEQDGAFMPRLWFSDARTKTQKEAGSPVYCLRQARRRGTSGGTKICIKTAASAYVSSAGSYCFDISG
jgi:hypothetical protein